MTETRATDEQVGGDYYRTLAIQPIVFSCQNQWDPAAHTVLKYLTRHKDKGREKDLTKALHTVRLRQEMIGFVSIRPAHAGKTIPVEDYIRLNGITGVDALAISQLAAWVNRESATTDQDLLDIITEARSAHYGN